MELYLGLRRSEEIYRLLNVIPAALKGPLLDAYAALAAARLSRAGGPSRLILYATGRCTRRCPHCFYIDQLSDDRGNELSLNRIRQLARSLPRRLALLTLTGGEPLLREDLPEIAGAFDALNRTRAISIITNGDLPQAAEAAARSLATSVAARLSFTVSVQTPQEIDPGSAPAETVERLLAVQRTDRRIESVAVQTTISKKNYAQLVELINMVEGRWRIPHKLQFVRAVTGCTFPARPVVLSRLDPHDLEQQALTQRQQLQIIALLRSRLRRAPSPLLARGELLLLELAERVQRTRQPSFPCTAGRSDGVIFENGTVSICEHFAPFAALSDFDDFASLWRSTPARAARAAAQGCCCTHPCNLATSLSYSGRGLRELLL